MAVSSDTVRRQQVIEKVAAFSFGVIFLAVMLGLALTVPNPTESQWQIFRVVLAAAAAGATVFLPGAVSLDVRPSLRASGALAVFALVYWFNPPKPAAPPAVQNEYNLDLKLLFPDGGPLPEEANVDAFVNDETRLSDYPGNPRARSKAVRRGQGGIVVGFSKLASGDKLGVIVEHSGRRWLSDDMKMPEAQLQMRRIGASAGGESPP